MEIPDDDYKTLLAAYVANTAHIKAMIDEFSNTLSENGTSKEQMLKNITAKAQYNHLFQNLPPLTRWYFFCRFLFLLFSY